MANFGSELSDKLSARVLFVYKLAEASNSKNSDEIGFNFPDNPITKFVLRKNITYLIRSMINTIFITLINFVSKAKKLGKNAA